jgi:hypothetical protein
VEQVGHGIDEPAFRLFVLEWFSQFLGQQFDLTRECPSAIGLLLSQFEAPIAVEFERSRQGSRRAKEINAWRERESTQVLTSRNTALRPRRWWRCCIAGMH